jgi:hypothetical protein
MYTLYCSGFDLAAIFLNKSFQTQIMLSLASLMLATLSAESFVNKSFIFYHKGSKDTKGKNEVF